MKEPRTQQSRGCVGPRISFGRAVPLKGSLKGSYKGSIVGFQNIGASIIWRALPSTEGTLGFHEIGIRRVLGGYEYRSSR